MDWCCDCCCWCCGARNCCCSACCVCDMDWLPCGVRFACPEVVGAPDPDGVDADESARELGPMNDRASRFDEPSDEDDASRLASALGSEDGAFFAGLGSASGAAVVAADDFFFVVVVRRFFVAPESDRSSTALVLFAIVLVLRCGKGNRKGVRAAKDAGRMERVPRRAPAPFVYSGRARSDVRLDCRDAAP